MMAQAVAFSVGAAARQATVEVEKERMYRADRGKWCVRPLLGEARRAHMMLVWGWALCWQRVKAVALASEC